MDEHSTSTLADDEILSVSGPETTPGDDDADGNRRRRHGCRRFRSPTLTTPTRTPTARTPRSSEALERAIGPIAVDRFLAEHWEQQPARRPTRRGRNESDNPSCPARTWSRLFFPRPRSGLPLPARQGRGDVAGYAGETCSCRTPPAAVRRRRRRSPRARQVRARSPIVLLSLHRSWLPASHAIPGVWKRTSATRRRRTCSAPAAPRGCHAGHDARGGPMLSLQVAGEKR